MDDTWQSDSLAAPMKGHHRGLYPIIRSSLGELAKGARILDAGCGEGQIAGPLIKEGFRVSGIDIEEWKVSKCSRAYPEGHFISGSVCDETLPDQLGCDYNAIICVEVIEHVFSPDKLLANLRSMLADDGVLVMTTPYHGYLKNLVLAICGKAESHFLAEREGGHIRFWSKRTLGGALAKHGFAVVDFRGWGRMPYLWKSMILKAVKK